MNDLEPDLQEIDEALWETYLQVCRAEGTTPSIKDYLVWQEENYA